MFIFKIYANLSPIFFTEAFAFVKREEVTAEEFGAKRLKLKSLIKQKVRKARSDQRKNESFSKKRKTPRS